MKLFSGLGSRLYSGIRRRSIESYYASSLRWGSAAGVTEVKRARELIVSLTTIPERIPRVAIGIETLLRQSLRPDRIILWLTEYEDDDGTSIGPRSLPENLERLESRGLEIRWCEDQGSYRKIIPTLREFPDAIVVTADDDILYPRQWLESLYAAYQREPHYIHCHLSHQIRYGESGIPLPYRRWNMRSPGIQGPSLHLFPTSGAGALYAPGHLHPEVMNQDAFLSLCPRADDVWLKAMSLLAGTPCKKVAPETFEITPLRIPNNRTLFSYNVGASGNDLQIAAVQERYGCFHRYPTGPAPVIAV